MSSISAVSSGGSQAFAPRFDPAKMRDKLFAKVDSDGSGSVDKTELQGLADKVAKATGGDSVNTDDIFSKADTDGDGKLSKDEFGTALKSIMPQPSSTVDFAQAHGAGGPQPGAGGPPPGGGGGGGGGDSSASGSTDSASSTSSSTSTTYDPLDTNQDGVVSTQERLAGALKTDLAKDLFNSMDTDSDGKISSSEADTFAQSLTSQVQANASAARTSSTNTSASTSSDEASAKHHAMGYSRLIEMVLQQYDQVASNSSSTSSSSSSVSVLA